MKTIFRADRDALIIEAIRDGCDNLPAIRAATGIPRSTLSLALAVLYAKHGANGLDQFCEQVCRNEIKLPVKPQPPVSRRKRDFIIMDTGMAPAAAAFFVAQWNAAWVSQFCEELGRELARNAKLSME